jgi:hypothetical protein
MSISALIRAMAAAGANAEAIAIAVEAVEIAHGALDAKRAGERDRKRRQRDKDKNGTVTGQSQDNPATVTDAKTISPNDIYSNPHKTHSAKAELPLFEKRVVEVWNEAAAKHGLTSAKALDPSRKSKLRARVRDHGEQVVLDGIRNLTGSRFHCGDNDRNWAANIGWFLTAANFVKAMEMAPPKAGPAKLSGDELAEHRARLAEHYENTGKTVEAADIRRQLGPRHIGNITADILQRREQSA